MKQISHLTCFFLPTEAQLGNHCIIFSAVLKKLSDKMVETIQSVLETSESFNLKYRLEPFYLYYL
jgi:hypothetical protein